MTLQAFCRRLQHVDPVELILVMDRRWVGRVIIAAAGVHRSAKEKILLNWPGDVGASRPQRLGRPRVERTGL